MYSFKAINLLELDEQGRQSFHPLCDNLNDIVHQQSSEGERLLAIAAYKENLPIGLAYGYAYPLIEKGFIRYIFVQEEYRRQGVGSQLLAKITDEFRQLNIQFLTWEFYSWLQDIDIIKHIQLKQGWSSPSVVTERYHFDAATFSPPWYKEEKSLIPKGYKIFLWRFLNPKQEKEIRQFIKPHSTLTDISPFNQPDKVEKMNSLGLKKDNKIAGWMITHRIDKDTIRYSALFIHSELRGLGPAIGLLKESIRLHKASPVKSAYTEINLRRTPRYWVNFVRKRLAPYATRKEEILLSFLDFNEETKA